MLTTSDFSKGVRILIDGEPYAIVEVNVQGATGRGGNTLVKVKARNMITGRMISEQYKSGSKFEEPDLRYGQVQYVYSEAEDAWFMDQESYEQFKVPLESIGDQARYLSPDVSIKAMYFNGVPVNIELPTHVPVKVSFVEPGDRGNTATGTVFTRAELENGHDVQVPLSIKAGDMILVNTTDHTYYQRA